MSGKNIQVMQGLLSLMRKISKRYDAACISAGSAFGLSISEAHVILFLANNEKLNTAMDVVNHRGISKSLVSKSIESLVSRGYLSTRQDKEDRRYARLFLLPAAQEAAIALQNAQSSYVATLFEALTPEEQLEFLGMSQKISACIDKSLKE